MIGGGVAATIVVVVVVAAAVAALISDGDGDVVGGGGVPAGGAGEISEIILYSDPLDPVLSHVDFVASDELPIDAIEFSGSKTGGAAIPESALIRLAGGDESLLVEFDEAGRPDQLQTSSGAAFKIEYQGDMATVHFLGADGRFGVESAPLDQVILDALDQVVARVTAAREGAEGEAKLISANPVRSDSGPAPLAAAAEGDIASLVAKAVHRSATFNIRAETAEGDDATRAICCFQISASGEQPSGIARISRSAGGMVVTVLHQVPIETILERVQGCEDWPWWAIGSLAAVAVVGSIFGGPILVALGVGAAELAGLVAGVSAISIVSVGMQATAPSCVEMTTAELRAEYLGKSTTLELCPFGDQIEAFAPRCTDPVSYRPFDPARPDELGGFTFIVTLKDDVGDLEDCNLGRTGSNRPPAWSPRLIINAPWGEDTSLLVPQREDQPQPFFAPPGYITRCGPVVVEEGSIAASGTLDPGQGFETQEGFLGFESNEITLAFPVEGGEVVGVFNVAMRIDTGVPILDADFRQTGTCIAITTLSGLLEGTYDGERQLSGTTTVTPSGRFISEECTSFPPPPESAESRWSGSFDGQRVTVRIEAEGESVTFTALVRN